MSDIVLGIRLTADGKDLVGAVRVSTDEIDKMTGATKRAGSEADKLNSQQKSLGETLNLSASMIGLYSAAWNKAVDVMFRAVDAVKNYVKESALLNARYETMGVVLEVIGRNAGYSRREMDLYAESVRKNGITMIASREGVVKMAQANLDLADASKLARAAQDAAVIANINSSEAFTRLIYAIQSGQPEMLRTMGINATFETSYAKVAKQLGVTVEQLTEQEKVQARANVVLQATTTIAGAYEAAMDTAGKKLNSLARYTENLKVKLGETFNDALVIAVDSYTDALKNAGDETDKLARDNKLKEWGRDLVTVMAYVIDQFKVFKFVLVEIATPMERLWRNLQTIISSWTILLSTGSFAEKVSAMTLLRDDNEAYFKALDDRLTANRNMRSAVSEMEAYFRAKDGEAAARAAAAISGWDNDMDVSAYHGAPGKRPSGKTAAGSDPYPAMLKSLKEKLLLDKESTEVRRLQLDLDSLSEKQAAKLNSKKIAALFTAAREVDAKNQALAADKATLEYTKFQIEQRDKNDEALNAFNTTMSEHLQQIQFETELYGKTEEQKQIAIELRKLDAEYVKAQIGLDKDHLATLTAIYEARRAQLPQVIADNNAARLAAEKNKQLAEDLKRGQVDAWQSIDRTAHDTFVSIFDSGKSAFDRLRDTLKNGLYDLLYQMTLKKWIINIAASVSGAGVATSAFGASGGSIAGNLAGSLISNVGGASIFGSGVGGLGGLLSTGSVMTAAPVYEAGALVSAGTSASIFSGSGASAVMSAIPGWGWAALGAAAIGAYLLSGDSDAQRSGNWSARLGQPGGSDNNRWFSGEEMNASLAAFSQTLAASEQQIIKTLHLSADQVGQINTALDAISGKQYGFGLEHTDWQQSGAAQAIAADRLKAIADALGTSVERLTQDLTDMQKAIDLAPQKRQLEIRLLEAQGDKVGALAAKRADELAATDALLRPLLEQVYAAEDLAAAANDATGAVRTLAQQIGDLRGAASTAVDDQLSASRSAAQAARSAADAYRGLNATLADTVRQLRGGDLSPLLPGQKLAEARAQLNAVYGKAATGDAVALAALPQVATDFLSASRAYNASSQAYTNDFNRVMGLLAQAEVTSTAMANHQDYQATLLEIQTGVLEDIKAELAAPNPDTELLKEQAAMLSTIADALQAQTVQIVAGNDAQTLLMHDQTGKIILSNEIGTDQTGRIVLGNSLLDSQTSTIAAAAAKDQAQAGQLIGGVVDGNKLSRGQTDLLSVANTAQGLTQKLLNGQTAEIVGGNKLSRGQTDLLSVANTAQGLTQKLLNGQTAEIVGGNLILRDQSGLITSSNELLVDQTGKINIGNTLAGTQTETILTGNATQDAIKELSSLNTSYSENMLAALVDSGGLQADSLNALVVGNATVVSLLQQLIGLQSGAGATEQYSTLAAWNDAFYAYAMKLYQDMKVEGQQFDLGGYDTAIAQWKAAHPIPEYAAGGVASGWSIVGEQGPELVNFTSPGRVYTADQTRAAFGGAAANDDLLAEIKALRAEVAALRIERSRDAKEQTARISNAVEDSAQSIGRTVARATEAGSRA